MSIDKVLARIKRILEEETLSTVKSDNFKSALFFLLYIRGEKKLSLTQKVRLLTLSISNINSFPSLYKLVLRDEMVKKIPVIKKPKVQRKKNIYMKRKCYAEKKMEKLNEWVWEKFYRLKIHKRVSSKIERKLNKI